MRILCSIEGIVSPNFPNSGIRDIVAAGYVGVVVSPLEDVEDFKRICNACKNAGVDIVDATKNLLMNQTKIIGGHHVRGLYSDALEAVAVIDSPNNEYSGFNFDVGNANLCALNMQDFITTLGTRLKMITLSDNDGNIDSSLLPFTSAHDGQSRTDWLGIIRGLRAIGFDGDLVMKFTDTALACSTLIRPELIKFSKIIADFIAWQINIESFIKRYEKRVVFGAGNMCRAYMKCYGVKYPPLFTCDNNSKLWNTEFCGLTVKSPEALLELPKDCAVFICNVYYKEIEQQIRDMGIKNPIERFNDEYLPTLHFTRLQRGENYA